MNRVSAAIIFALVVISACIVFLIHDGISLRAAPLIKPSIMDSDHGNIADSIITRLFQELQNSHYVVWGVLPETKQSEQILAQTAQSYQRIFGHSVHFLRDAEKANADDIRACSKPCWLTVTIERASQLEKNLFMEQRIMNLDRIFFSLTIVAFQPDQVVSDECNNQKRLTLKCLTQVSVRAAKRKMKNLEKEYFFMNKYNEKDYFLFIQQRA